MIFHRRIGQLVRCLYVCFLCGVLAFMVPASAVGPAEPVSSVDLVNVPLSQLLALYFRDMRGAPFVVCNDVLLDTRSVSLRASGPVLDSAILGSVLELYGYQASVKDGVTVICKRSAASDAADSESLFLYRPMYRDAAYLVGFLSGLVKGSFANKRAPVASMAVGGASVSPVSPGGPTGGAVASSAVGAGHGAVGGGSLAVAMQPNNLDDFILFSGSELEVGRLKKLLLQVDVPLGEVVVKGHIYEVGRNGVSGSAFDVLLSVLGGKVQVSASSASGPLSSALRLKAVSLELVASMLQSDGRFKVVTSPFTRVRSGGTARFVVGSEVPVLGAIVTNQGGATSQSVEYRSSGVIFEVSPHVRDRTTDLDVFEQISTFVTTQTGVSGSPTLNKRELRTSLSVEDGELLVIGGLNDSKDDESAGGLSFLPFSLSRSKSSTASELLLVLEVKRI